MEISDEILKTIKENGYQISRREMMKLTNQQAMKFYAKHSGSINFVDFLKFMVSSPVIGLELTKENAVGDFQMLCGPEDPR